MNDGIREEFGRQALRIANLEKTVAAVAGQMDQLRKDQVRDEEIQKGLRAEMDQARNLDGALDRLEALMERVIRRMDAEDDPEPSPRPEPDPSPGRTR